MKTYKTEGIILKRSDFGEADRILTIFTKHYGKMRVIAKGVRKTTSRKGPSLELFNHVRIFVARGKNLDIVTEAEVINSFSKFRKNLKKVALAYQACELVDKLTAERAESREVFELLKDYLSQLTCYQLSAISNQQFALALLEFLGFWPKDESALNPSGLGSLTRRVDIENYIESLIEKKLKSKKFLNQV